MSSTSAFLQTIMSPCASLGVSLAKAWRLPSRGRRMVGRGSRRAFVLGVFAALAAPALFAAEQLYTCGMHPQVISREPGNCPICGMKLQPIRANSAAPGNSATSNHSAPPGPPPAAPAGGRKITYYKSTMMPGEVSPGPAKDSMGMDMAPVYEEDSPAAEEAIQVDSATLQKMNLQTGLVERGPVRRQIRAVGVVEFNERTIRDITLKYDAWIEKLRVDATWTLVRAGDPLFEVYSPDLYNAESNYLVAAQAEGPAGGSLTRAAGKRLELLGVPAGEVAALPGRGEVPRTCLYAAPSSGVVIEKLAVEGQMVKAGEPIYRLADLSTVWVNAQIYEEDLPGVSAGQAVEVRVTHGSEPAAAGTIEQLLPQVQADTRTTVARIALPNADGALRPGMFVDVRLAVEVSPSAILAPDSAVLRSGERNTVFVALPGGRFEPRAVKLGARTDNYRYEVLGGLREGERVVTSGQFLLDSESQLREAIQKMLRQAAR